MSEEANRPIFHLKSEALRLLERPREALDVFLTFVESNFAAFSNPDHTSFHAWHQMPPPSFEYAWGLKIPAGATYRLPFSIRGDGMITLNLGVRAQAEVRIAGETFEIKRNRKGDYVVKGARERVSIQEDWISLSCRIWQERVWFAAGGKPIGSAPLADRAWPVEIKVQDGECALIAGQSLDGNGRFLSFSRSGSENENLVEFREERNPFRFAWGLRSCSLLNILIAIAVARDLRAALAGELAPDDICHRLDAVVGDQPLVFLLDQFLKWPYWRPGEGNYPECGAWDRNSFTNGTLPAIVALLARMTGRDADPQIVERFHDFGSAFLNSLYRAEFLEQKARNEAHWLKRSANHGLIMMSGYLIGAKLLGQDGLDDVKRLDRMFGTMLHQLHEDGSFCEGVAYEFFGLSYFLPYVALHGADHVYSDSMSMQTLHPLLGKTFDWISLSHNAEGKIFANFGDNFRDTIRKMSHLAYVQAYSSGSVEVPNGYTDCYDEFFSLAPPLRFDRVAGERIVSRLHPDNRTYLAAAYDEAGERKAGLFVIGSRVQMTHNHNHDCGGFAFYWGDSAVRIAEPRRESYFNNAGGVMSGGKIVSHAGRRNYSGTVEAAVGSADTRQVRTRVSFNNTFAERNAAEWMERTFTFRPYSQIPLIILTRIKASPLHFPFIAFNTRNLGLSGEVGDKWLRVFLHEPMGAWRELKATQPSGVQIFAATEADQAAAPYEFLAAIGSGDMESIDNLLPHAAIGPV